jgi:hypothetical protein
VISVLTFRKQDRIKLVQTSCLYLASSKRFLFITRLFFDPKHRSRTVAIIVVSTLFTKREFSNDRRILDTTKAKRIESTLLAYRKLEAKLNRKLARVRKELSKTAQALHEELVRTVIVGQFPHLEQLHSSDDSETDSESDRESTNYCKACRQPNLPPAVEAPADQDEDEEEDEVQDEVRYELPDNRISFSD